MNANIKRIINGINTELTDLFARAACDSLDDFLELLRGRGKIFVAGAGRSGLLLRCFAMRMMHMGKSVYMVGDTTTPAAENGDVLLIGSGSGETGSLTAVMHKAATLGMRKALITTSRESTLGKLADIVIVLPAPTPKRSESQAHSKQPMGNLFEQGMFLLLEAVVMELMAQEKMTSESMFRLHANLE